MKDAKLVAKQKIEIYDTSIPEISGPKDVLIKVKSVGVCGSDVHYFSKGQIGSQVVKFPFTVGHEGAGEVIAVGSDVTRVKPGDRIAIEPAMPCFECDQCKAGRENTCRKLKFLGCPGQAEGCFRDYLIMPETSCYPIPDNMSFDEAALSEPLAIGVYAVKQSIPMKGKTIGILGSGPIGFSVMLPAIAQGAEKVYMTDKIDGRLELAKAHGATWIGNPDKINVVEEIKKEEPLLLDCIFECCGEQEAMDQAIELLKPGGKLMLIGIPPVAERVSFKIDYLRRKEICIQNVRRQNHSCQDALDMIARGDFDVKFMATHHFVLDDLQKAMELVENYEDGVLKAMIRFEN